MLQFKNTKLLWLFYEIVGWLVMNKLFPKKMEFWQNTGDKNIYCNVYYCPDQQVKTDKTVIDNKEEQIHKRITNQYPTLREEELSNELSEHVICKDFDDIPPFGYPDVRKSKGELTDAEKAYADYLKRNPPEIAD